MRVGVHVSIAGGIDRAAERAARIGCEAFQVFVKSNRQWAARALEEGEADRFRRRCDEHGLGPAFAHASYLLNLASTDDALRERSRATCALELERCGLLGLEGLVLHPGAHGGAGAEPALERILAGLQRIVDAVPDGRREASRPVHLSCA